MTRDREFFSDVRLNGHTLAALRRGAAPLKDRYLLKDFLEFIHLKKGLLEAYGPGYPLVEPRELLPSFEKNFAEYPELPSFSMVAFNRTLSYQDEIFQFDLLHPPEEGGRRGRNNLDRFLPYLDRELRAQFKQRFGAHDLTNLARYESLLPFLFHMDRAHVIAKDSRGDFRLLGVYASFPSDLDAELKLFGRKLGKFKETDPGSYERERGFVYQFLMELYGYPIAAERRTSAALFARKLSRYKEQYLIKVLGASDRTLTSLCGYEQKRYPLVEKTALIALPASLAEGHPHLKDQGYYVDEARRVVILKVTYQQHKYNRLNVLEDRALGVLKQELIHPYHGGRDPSLNLLKDPRRSLKELTDIVRGEHPGTIVYQRTDLIASTKTHGDRLKFLSAWLAKHQRRLGAYSAESFEAAKKVLNSYLLNREYRDAFRRHEELHREVLQHLAWVTQAQLLHSLEKLAQDERALGPPGRRLAQALDFLQAHQGEIPYFYPDLFDKFLRLWEQFLAHPYFRQLAAAEAPPERPVRRRAWQMLALVQNLADTIKERHRQIMAEVERGVPFPLVLPSFLGVPPGPER
jgi:hypothetical protein